MAPLTEHEKRQLRMLENQLRTEDPKFVKAMRSNHMGAVYHRGPKKQRSRLGIVTFSLGVILLITGLVMQSIVVGFLGCFILSTSFIRACWNLVAVQSVSPSSSQPKTKSTFMTNLESRWAERKKNDPS